MAINRTDGKFQVSYWLDASKVANNPDDIEYSDSLMELRQRIYKVFRQRSFKYAAIYQWNPGANDWDLVDECEPRNLSPKSKLLTSGIAELQFAIAAPQAFFGRGCHPPHIFRYIVCSYGQVELLRR